MSTNQTGLTVRLPPSFLRAARFMQGWQVNGEFFAIVSDHSADPEVLAFGLSQVLIFEIVEKYQSFPDSNVVRVRVRDPKKGVVEMLGEVR